MAFINSYEDIAKLENEEYINSLPDFEYGIGKIPPLESYLKLSCDSDEERMTLAKIGAIVAEQVVPGQKLYFNQALLLGAAFSNNPKYRSIMFIGNTRYGKLLADSTPVFTTKGWKTHGDLHTGDYVFSPSGKPIMVLAESDKKPVEYRVHFRNGQYIDCHGDHEWKVYSRKKYSTVVSTKDLYKFDLLVREYSPLRKKYYERSRYYVDKPRYCEFPTQELPIDPYFLGCWLGDGYNCKPALCLSDKDRDAILHNIPYIVTSCNKQVGSALNYFGNNDILDKIRSLDLFKNKHIPDIYKYASFEQQKALLAGMIDTDGYMDNSSRIIISNTNKRLVDDIMELLTIMGLSPYYTVTQPAISSSGIKGTLPVYQIGFQPIYDLPIQVKRKHPSRFIKPKRMGIVKIEKINTGELGKCIEVDSEDGMYLVGETLIPTHNSYLTGLIGIASAALLKKEVRIGGATRDKADIVMEKIIGFMPNTSPEIQEGMMIGDDDATANKKIARLSTQTSREALSWKTGGSIKMFTMSETSKNKDVAGAGAIGIGGDTQIYDESELISNGNYYTARRFLVESSNTKLIELANPLTNNHLRDTYDSDATFVLHFCDVTSILEKRMTRKDIDLTLIPKHTPEYRGFVQALFPPQDQGSGFFGALPKPMLEMKNVAEGEVYNKIRFMGIDSAYQGADGLVVTIVSMCTNADGTKSWLELEYQEDLKKKHPRWQKDTTIQVALDIMMLREKYNVASCCIDIAFGIHVYEMIQQLAPDFPIEPVNFGSKPTESRKEVHYSATWAYNLRAEMHLDVKEFCENELLFVENKYYDDLLREMREIRLENEMGKIKIEGKKSIKGRLGSSPDHLDSLCLAVRALIMSGILGGVVDDGEEIAYIEG